MGLLEFIWGPGPMSFRGGVHVPEVKHATENLEIKNADLPSEVIIPLIQHIGAPSVAKVKPGDRVKTGQKIGEAGGLVSVPVHSSISGTVTAIREYIHPTVGKSPAIFIKSDNRDELDSSIKERENFEELSPAEIKEIVKEAGIVGLGGAAFPTHIKLSPPEGTKIEMVILNGAECEPYLTCDYRIMLEKTREVFEGFKLIMKALEVTEGYIGIEINKKPAGKLFEQLAEKEEKYAIDVVPLKVKYPQGAEKTLIKTITGREVPSGGLPMAVGCVVQNVGTALAVYEAVRFGKPLYERVITVGGYGIKRPQNLRVRIGTLFSDLIPACEGFTGDPGKIICGGPMMGIAQYTVDFPVVKGTSGILVFPEDVSESEAYTACIRCGRCLEACPMRLVPTLLASLCQNGRFGEAVDNGLNDCVECGCCAYVCPARIPLVQLVKYGKSAAAKIKKNG